MPEIKPAWLRLRLFTPADLDDLACLFGDPKVMRYLGAEAGTTLPRAETGAALAKFIGDWHERGFGRWAVVHKETQRFIGLCGFKLLVGEAELIYVPAQAY